MGFDQVLPNNPGGSPTGARRAEGENASLSRPEAQLELVTQYPMYVVPIEKVMKLDALVPHEEIFDDLVEWKAGMGDVLFCSHTWLGRSHPDPSGVKLDLLKKLFFRMQVGKQEAAPTWLAEMWFGAKKVRVNAAAMKKIRYVWFDLCSVPQADPEKQARAINSIFSYVHDSAHFMVLAGPWEHGDYGHLCDCRAWMKRGWCRLELLANAMSPTTKQVLLAASPASVESHGPSGLFGQKWFSAPVGKGNFSVEADRAALGPVVEAILKQRKQLALKQGDLLTYRFIHAATAATLADTGTVPVQEASVGEWMRVMKFETVHDGKKTGWTPLMFAVIANRVELCAALLDAGADPKVKFKQGYVQYGLRKDMPVLHAACATHDCPEIVQLLIARGADPFKKMPFWQAGKPAAQQAAGFGHMGNLDALHAAGGDRLIAQKDFFSFTLLMACVYAHDLTGSVEHCLKHYLELCKPDLHSKLMDMLSLGIMGVGDVPPLEQLLEAGCDPNGNVQRMPFGQYLQYQVFNLMAACGTRSALAKTMLYMEHVAPLHAACFMGHLGAVRLLLAKGADPNAVATHHPKRPAPLHLAALQGHEAICDALLAAGAHPRPKDWRGRTPAQWALWRSNDDTAQALQYLGRGDAEGDAPDLPLRAADDVRYQKAPEPLQRSGTRRQAGGVHQADVARRD